MAQGGAGNVSERGDVPADYARLLSPRGCTSEFPKPTAASDCPVQWTSLLYLLSFPEPLKGGRGYKEVLPPLPRQRRNKEKDFRRKKNVNGFRNWLKKLLES